MNFTILRRSSLTLVSITTRSVLYAHTRRHTMGRTAIGPVPTGEGISMWPSWNTLLRLTYGPLLATRSEPRQPESQITEPTRVYEGYPFHKSTAEVHHSTTKEFRPQYARARGSLDYAYHFMPTLARQRLQDRIIEEALGKGEVSDEPWLLFTAGGFACGSELGAMGAGKSWSMKRISEKGYFKEESFVRVDPDDLRCVIRLFVSLFVGHGFESGCIVI
eukprot:1136794-Pyramimonas_sp.AAC.1